MARWDGHTEQDKLDTIARKRANEQTKRQVASAAKPPKQKQPHKPKPKKLKHGPVTLAPPVTVYLLSYFRGPRRLVAQWLK